MFNLYNLTVSYKQADGLDMSGNKKYKPQRSIKARQVSGGVRYVVDKEHTDTIKNKEFHIPFEIFEGDMINDRLVKSVEPANDVFGKTQFWVVVTE